MTNWDPRANELFLKALELRSGEERRAFLDAACAGEATLRAEVESLLEANAGASGFLESPIPPFGATVDEPIRQRPGTVIGPYKLLQAIGEGGMGAVFMAEQTRPVQRKVALKLIKPGMDSGQVIARFEAERQALALMDHPNIAKVFDGGATESGRPYFVMELVKGVALTKYCDEQRLTLRQRLELFIPVCQAVQHAHQKGIIHRDLKPSNVLVALYDGKPVPKVIDFGVAKAAGEKLTDKTLFTAFGSVVGTLEYMSPEQAELNQLDIDTRSDIYSLGVLLYELLTGTTPLGRERLKETGLVEALRIIREEEPPRPSMRLSTTAELPAVAANRGLEPRKLSGAVRGDLDWIVMKCLDKDRNRRYETANSVAMDMRRCLRDEPVLACPPSAGYRLRKFVRKHRRPLATTAVFVVLLIAVAVGASLAAWRLGEAEKATRQQLHLTEQAQDEATRRLYRALVLQARASRRSHGMGQRFDGIAALEQATQIARQLRLPDDDFLELRDEAIACLALPDLRVARDWPGWPTGTVRVDFDGALERYARADRPGTISVRRVADDAELYRIHSGLDEPWLLLSPDGSYLAAWSARQAGVKVWRLASPEPSVLVDQQGGVAAAFSAAFSPDGRRFALGLDDGSIQVYDLAVGGPPRVLAPGPRPQCLAFHPRERRLAVGQESGIQVRDCETGDVLTNLPGAGDVTSLAWRPDGTTLAAAGGDRVVSLWDVPSGRPTVRLEGITNGGIALTFNHAGDLLATQGWEGKLRLWDACTGEEVFRTPAAGIRPRFSLDDRFLAADIRGERLQLWEVATSRVCRTLARPPSLGPGRFYAQTAFSRDGRVLACAMTDGLGFWDARSGTPLAFAAIGFVHPVVCDASGALLTNGVSSARRWPVRLDPASPGLVRVGPPEKLPLPTTYGSEIACSPDGQVVVSAQKWGVQVWRRGADSVLRLSPHDDTRYVSVSPDGRWVVSGSHNGTGARVWDARTGDLARELLPDESYVKVRFSPDGRWLATCTDVLRLWAVGSWQEGPVQDETNHAFAFSPDGKLLAVENSRGVVRLIAPDDGREYARLEDPGQVRAGLLAFSPDGAQLALTGNESKKIQLWDLRALREELAARGLDWDRPPYPPAEAPEDGPPLRVEVDLGDLASPLPPRPQTWLPWVREAHPQKPQE